ncbi:heterokaryon incompatibility protein-domain-containing protein [Aspergillus parasiticus]|uniref:Heterokaryon incompatibility protein-domain-containing protein n=1 Tax=Aspergillus parasiticus TaxID=5067 RepID=A0A5N6D727_ASPPA|nr:heterokaryon incompatibility protein-domain-containing protein [Aspergillus parasiticus]
MPSSMTSKSQLYQALVQNTREIRLVSVTDGSLTTENPDLINCRYQVFELDKAPPYHALSYTWGDPTFPATILLNGVEIQVTRNLHFALKRLQRLHDVQYIWIDAICIDQSNILEKNYQVPLMGQIYSGACFVLVCLGDEADDSALAMDTFADWARAKSKVVEIYRSSPRPYIRYEFFSELLKQMDDPFALRKQTSLQKLCSRPYWKRLWILQEIQRAKEVRIYCGPGTKYVNWRTICQMLGHLIWLFDSERFTSPEHDMSVVEAANNLYYNIYSRLRNVLMLSQEIHLDLDTLYRLTDGSLASNPLDRIYGFINLASQQPLNLVPDYHLTPAELYRDFVLLEIERTDQVNIVCLSQTNMAARVTPELPSWVPDLQVKPVRGFSQYRQFEAGRGLPLSVSFHKGKTTMRMVGIRCGKVTHVDPPGLGYSNSALDRRYALALTQCAAPAANGVSLVQALFRTVFFESTLLHSYPETDGPPDYGQGLPDLYWCFVNFFHYLSDYPTDTWQFLSDFAEVLCQFPGFLDRLFDLTMAPQHSPSHLMNITNLLLATLKSRNIHTGISDVPIRESNMSVIYPILAVLFTLGYSETVSYLALVRQAKALRTYAENYGFIIIDDGYIGTGPGDVQVNDVVCVFPGLRAPAVLRPRGNDWGLVGDCYIDGMMQGEMVNTRETEVFNIL